jgi:hypothetical protein
MEDFGIMGSARICGLSIRHVAVVPKQKMLPDPDGGGAAHLGRICRADALDSRCASRSERLQW